MTVPKNKIIAGLEEALERATKTVTINMRARRSVVDQIDIAAKARGMSRSKFIRDAAFERARAILAEQMAARKTKKR
jgi:uncharacterized protein (DUF1778 family)